MNERPQSGARAGPLIRLRDPRLILVLALAILAGGLAYQAPPAADLRVGWLGDQLFLPTGEGLGAAQNGRWYGDEMTPDARSGRSRWTRQESRLTLPALGATGELTLGLRLQGWPADVLNRRTAQPEVTVEANGTPIGSFQPSGAWADYELTVPAAAARAAGDLTVTLRTSDVFTDTLSYGDRRPKGVRVEQLTLRAADLPGPLPPALAPLAWLALCAGLAYLSLSLVLRRPTLTFVLATLLVSAASVGLALARAWTAALLPLVALLLALALAAIGRRGLLAALRHLIRLYSLGDALNYGLVAAAAAWLAYTAMRALALARPPSWKIFRDNFPDSLLFGALAMGLLLWIVVRGRDGLPRISNAIVGFLGSHRGAAWLLASFAAIWIGYEAYVIAGMAYVGHADYADNAVVARNLLAGRGWVVDYVTQFYRLYNGVTRPQETWPLLQPLWILPFFAMFGPTPWAAKIPNLMFTALLGVLVFAAGSRLWDRRVGLTAAIIVLTSQWFFLLAIYTTSDLAFTVFAFGAIWLAYRWTTDDQRRGASSSAGGRWPVALGRWSLAGSGVLTGLMLLQKPGSGALIAAGIGLWLLAETIRAWRLAPSDARRPSTVEAWRARYLSSSPRRSIALKLAPLVIWGTVALLILSPYLVRNLWLFGTPLSTTESLDAWVLEYTDWEDIYKVFTPDAGLSETGGLPDRSWILRWGFDRTILKLVRQVAATRDYLLPPWEDLPLAGEDWLSGRKTLLFPMGGWLSLLGAIGALRSRRRLMALLTAAFVPYAIFLILYWHANEERYFVVVMPWLAILAAYAVWYGYDRLASIGDGRWAPVGLALACTALVLAITPSWPKIADKVQVEPVLWQPDIDAYTWLRENTRPDEVVMTRLPWQANWHSERPTLMVPNTGDRERFLRIARYYNARYLVIDTLNNPSAQTRLLIAELLEDPAVGFEEVYASPVYMSVDERGRPVALSTEVYRFPDSYGDVAEIQP